MSIDWVELFFCLQLLVIYYKWGTNVKPCLIDEMDHFLENI